MGLNLLYKTLLCKIIVQYSNLFYKFNIGYSKKVEKYQSQAFFVSSQVRWICESAWQMNLLCWMYCSVFEHYLDKILKYSPHCIFAPNSYRLNRRKN